MTDDELSKLYRDTVDANRDTARLPYVPSGLRAVADAAHRRAVEGWPRMSEAEIRCWWHSPSGISMLIAMLRKRGVIAED